MRRSIVQGFGLLVVALLTARGALAGDPNNAIGFSSNHILADGGFGENIDLLTGSVNLSFPIGPRYQMGPSLSYQFTLYYNSHFWAYDVDDNLDGTLKNLETGRVGVDGCFGAGVRGHLGRVYRDYNDYDTNGTMVWRLETPDGSQHYFGTESKYNNNANQFLTVDDTFIRMNKLADNNADGTLDGWVAEWPDGTRWILDHMVGNPENPHEIRPDKGWYVSRMEGPEDLDGAANTLSCCAQPPCHFDCDRAHWVEVDYDGTGSSPVAACPLHIRDSVGRQIGFELDLVKPIVTKITLPSGTSSPPGASLTYDFQYTNQPICDPRVYLIYGSHSCRSRGETTTRDSPGANMRETLGHILYPTSGTARFQIDLGWSGVDADADGAVDPSHFGLIVSRTLPYVQGTDHATVRYKYRYVTYAEDRSSRYEATKKKLTTSDGTGGQSYWWWYQRPDDDHDQDDLNVPAICTDPEHCSPGSISYYQAVEPSNPSLVRVWDPFNNLTEYSFQTHWMQVGASNNGEVLADLCYSIYASDSDGTLRTYTECPSFWDSGLLTGVRVYRGCVPDPSRLVRETVSEHEADLNGTKVKRFHYRVARTMHSDAYGVIDVYSVAPNIRIKKQTTRILDAPLLAGGAPTAAVEYSDWDARGHYRTVTEKNECGEVYRKRTTDYDPAPVESPWFTGRYSSAILQNASGQPVERTDYCWGQTGADGTKPTKITRRKDPSLTSVGCVGVPGDVVESLTYQTGASATDLPLGVLGNRTDSGGDGTQSFSTDYKYAAGAYLKTQHPIIPNQTWLTVDRDWDSIRGLVTTSRDSAKVQTAYSYDALGRLTAVTPPLPEAPTTITYRLDGRQVDVLQAEASAGTIASKYFYDNLYRVVTTQRLNAVDTSWSEQQMTYDAANRVVSRTEWAAVGASPGSLSSFDYSAYTGPSCPDKDGDGTHDADVTLGTRTYPDALGRITRSFTGGVETKTSYEGLITTVTVGGIAGPTYGGVTTSRTVYTNDGFGRLVSVNQPICAASATSCVGAPLDYSYAQAQYAYDVQDHLTEVLLKDGLPAENQYRRFGYDSLGQLRWATNPENGTQQYTQYGAAGNLRQKFDSEGRSFSYTYDAAGRLTQTARTSPQPTTILETNDYDSTDGRLKTTVSYDADGTAIISERTRVYGKRTPLSSDYEGLNKRLGEVQVKLGGWGAVLKTVYKYNSLGLVSHIDYPLQDEDLYNINGRTRSAPTYNTHNGYLTYLSDPNRLFQQANYLQGILYTPAGGVTRIDTPTNQHFNILYDAWNRPLRYLLTNYLPAGTSTCAGGGGGPYRLRWTPNCSDEFPCTGSPDQQPVGGGGCIPSTNASTETWWDTASYQYDGAGNINWIGSNYYRYDAVGRLREATASSGTLPRQWLYDAFGNMTEERRFTNNIPSLTREFAVSKATNRLLSLTDYMLGGGGQQPLPSTSYTYDQSGNMTSEGSTAYTWDDLGRMTSVDKAGGPNLARHSYDGSAYRVRMTEGATETFFIRDEAGQVLSEFKRSAGSNTAPVWDKDYIYALGRSVALVKNMAPAMPKNLRVTSIATDETGTALTIAWDPVNEPDIASYTLVSCGCVIPDPLCAECDSCPVVNLSRDITSHSETCSSPVNAPDAVVTYQLTANDTAFNSSEVAFLTVRPGGLPPVAPGIPAVSPGDRKVRLEWPLLSQDDLAGYKVFRSQGLGQTETVVTGLEPIRSQCKLATVCFTDTGLTNGTPYYYSIVAVDTALRTSAHSSPRVPATPLDNEPPSPPEGLQVLSGPGVGQITISWKPGTEADLAGYKLIHATSNSPTGTGATDISASCTSAGSCLDASLTPGGGYYYFVQARDQVGNWSGFSAAGPVRSRVQAARPAITSAAFQRDPRGTVPPPPPNGCDVGHAALDDGSAVALAFSSVTGALRYRIYRRATSADPWERIGETTGAVLQYLDANVGRPEYQYAVSAVTVQYPDGTVDEGPNSLDIQPVEDTFTFVGSPGIFNVDYYLERSSAGAIESIGPDRSYVHLVWSPCVEQRLVGYNVYRGCSAFVGHDGNCPGGWERISGLTPIRLAEFLDRDVNPSVRKGLGGLGYLWTYLVTAVLEREDRTHVETRAIDSGTVDLSSCNLLQCNSCSYAQSGYFPDSELPHEPALSASSPPTPPANLTANRGNQLNADLGDLGMVLVQWNQNSDPASNDASKLAGYYLEYRPYGGTEADWKPVDTYLEDSNGDGTLEQGTTPVLIGRFLNRGSTTLKWYHYRRRQKTEYRVRAVDQRGVTSNPSDSALGWPYMAAPRCFTAHYLGDHSSTALEWKDNDSDSTTGNFNIYRYVRNTTPSPAPDGELIASVHPGDPGDPNAYTIQGGFMNWTDTNRSSTLLYVYRIRAVYGSGSPQFEGDSTENDEKHTDDPSCSTFATNFHIPGVAPAIASQMGHRGSSEGPGVIWQEDAYELATTGTNIASDPTPGWAGYSLQCTLEPFQHEPPHAYDLMCRARSSPDYWPSSMEDEQQVRLTEVSDSQGIGSEDNKTPVCRVDPGRSAVLLPDGMMCRPSPPAKLVDRSPVSSGIPAWISSLAPTVIPPGTCPTLSAPARIGQYAPDPSWEVSLLWADHLGSTRVVSSMSGDRVTRHSYFPFGDRVDGAPDYATHEFTGHERDRETGLDYMMARYYGSSVARFFSPDPAFEITKSQRTPQQWNRYSYVMNNPLILIDPEGKVLTASGSQSAKDSFKQAADSGLMGKEVKVDSSGNVTLVSTDEQGPPTPEQSALEDTLNQAINDPATTSVNLTEGSPSALVGEYGTGEIDVKDVKALGTTPGVSAVGALGHEIAEQFSRQVKGMPPGNDTSGAHGAGIAAEDRINGSKRGPEFDILIRNKDGTASGVKEIPYTENGKKTISTLHIKHNDVTKVTER